MYVGCSKNHVIGVVFLCPEHLFCLRDKNTLTVCIISWRPKKDIKHGKQFIK